MIEQHGGQVDPSYSNRVTHVLCSNQKSDVFLLVSSHFFLFFNFVGFLHLQLGEMFSLKKEKKI